MISMVSNDSTFIREDNHNLMKWWMDDGLIANFCQQTVRDTTAVGAAGAAGAGVAAGAAAVEPP